MSELERLKQNVEAMYSYMPEDWLKSVCEHENVVNLAMHVLHSMRAVDALRMKRITNSEQQVLMLTDALVCVLAGFGITMASVQELLEIPLGTYTALGLAASKLTGGSDLNLLGSTSGLN